MRLNRSMTRSRRLAAGFAAAVFAGVLLVDDASARAQTTGAANPTGSAGQGQTVVAAGSEQTAQGAGQPAQGATAQKPTQRPATSSTASGQSEPPLPVNIDKIRELLDQRETLNLTLQRPRLHFYAEVTAKAPTFKDLVGKYDLFRGAAPHASALSGNEFMAMTTPKEMYSAAGITPTDMLQFALTNLAAQALVKKAIEEIRSAHDQAEVEAIRARIDRELRSLMGKGGGQP